MRKMRTVSICQFRRLPCSLGEDRGRLRIGVPRKFFYEDLDPEIASAVEQALGILRALGGDLSEIEHWMSPPTARCKPRSHTRITPNSFPGVRNCTSRKRCAASVRVKTSAAGEVEQRRRELEQIRSEIHKVFEDVDFLVTPTTPVPAPAIDELKQDPDLLRPHELLLLRNTRPVNVWGLPAISIPCGFTTAGLPIGLQIIGPHWREDRVLQLAYAYEQATDWHKRTPRLVEV